VGAVDESAPGSVFLCAGRPARMRQGRHPLGRWSRL